MLACAGGDAASQRPAREQPQGWRLLELLLARGGAMLEGVSISAGISGAAAAACRAAADGIGELMHSLTAQRACGSLWLLPQCCC